MTWRLVWPLTRGDLRRDLSLFLGSYLLFQQVTLTAEEWPFSGESYGFDQLVDRFREYLPGRIMEAVELLHQVSLELRQGYSPRFNLEIGIIRLLRVLDRPGARQRLSRRPSKPGGGCGGLKAVEAAYRSGRPGAR